MMTRPPWHFWPVIFLALLWYGVLALDYLAGQYDLQPYIAAMSSSERAWMDNLPGWIDGAFAIAALGGLLAVVLAIFRTRFVAFLFGIAALALLFVAIWAIFVSAPPVQQALSWQVAGILVSGAVLSLLIWLYARDLHRTGIID